MSAKRIFGIDEKIQDKYKARIKRLAKDMVRDGVAAFARAKIPTKTKKRKGHTWSKEWLLFESRLVYMAMSEFDFAMTRELLDQIFGDVKSD